MIKLSFPKRRESSTEPVWETDAGNLIALTQIHDRHLLNIERMLREGEYSDGFDITTYTGWYPIITGELDRRRIPYGQRIVRQRT